MKLVSRTSALMMAVATASVLSATSSFATSADMKELDSIVTAELHSVGIDNVDLNTLTHAQLADLTAIFDVTGSTDQQKADALRIINDSKYNRSLNTKISSMPSADELKAIVASDLDKLGIKIENPGKLTVEQLGQISEAYDSSKSEDQRVADVKKILGM